MKVHFAAPVVAAGLLLTANVCFSQSIDSIPRKDSLPKKVIAYVAERFPQPGCCSWNIATWRLTKIFDQYFSKPRKK